jgi:hypothetical protein
MTSGLPSSLLRMLRSISPRFVVCAIAAVALGLRIACVAAYATEPLRDAAWYYDTAFRIVQTGTYAADNGLPTAYWPVGYSFFLAMIFKAGGGIFAAYVANAILSTLSVVCVYWIARALFQSEIAAYVAMLFMALCPSEIMYCSLMLSETLFTTLMLLSAALAMRREQPAWATLLTGVVMGLASLVKPQEMPFAVIVLALSPRLVSASRAHHWRRLALVFALQLLVVAPWGARNWNVFHRFVVSTNGGINLYMGNNPSATGAYRFDDEVLRPLGLKPGEEFRGGPREAEIDAKAGQLALEFIRENFTTFLELAPKKLALGMKSDGSALGWASRDKSDAERERVERWLKVTNWFYAAMLRLAAIGLGVLLFRKRYRAFLSLAAAIGYWCALIAIFFGSPRFHAPAMPWIICAAGAWVLVFRRVSEAGGVDVAHGEPPGQPSASRR